MYYNDILRYAYANKYVKTRASITSLVNLLTNLGILERTAITDTRPMRTRYSLTKKGKTILQQLKQIEQEIRNKPHGMT